MVVWPSGDIESLTLLFFVLVLLTATHDIAVDGWALTLLSKEYLNLSTSCQTLVSPNNNENDVP